LNAPAPVVIRCAGAPRDLGLDQGAALRSQVRRAARAHWARRTLEWARRQHKSLRRDLLRYFPHQAERMTGLARGAGVGSARLAALLAQTPPGASALARAGAGETGESAEAERAEAGGGARLDCNLPLHFGRVDDFVLRHSAPDNDRASVEIAFAWQAPALVGVNADGLAVCALPGVVDAAGAANEEGAVGAAGEVGAADAVGKAGAVDAAKSVGEEGAVDVAREGGCAAPALLLAQDCLRLFDQTPNALEWIRSRPAGGCCTLLLADASGRIAGAMVMGERRAELQAQNGRIAISGAAAGGDGATENRDDSAAENSLRVLADPLGRRLGVQPPGGALLWHQADT